MGSPAGRGANAERDRARIRVRSYVVNSRLTKRGSSGSFFARSHSGAVRATIRSSVHDALCAPCCRELPGGPRCAHEAARVLSGWPADSVAAACLSQFARRVPVGKRGSSSRRWMDPVDQPHSSCVRTEHVSWRVPCDQGGGESRWEAGGPKPSGIEALRAGEPVRYAVPLGDRLRGARYDTVAAQLRAHRDFSSDAARPGAPHVLSVLPCRASLPNVAAPSIREPRTHRTVSAGRDRLRDPSASARRASPRKRDTAGNGTTDAHHVLARLVLSPRCPRSPLGNRLLRRCKCPRLVACAWRLE